jgi:transcriptional regulator with XRE-family HTH domain
MGRKSKKDRPPAMIQTVLAVNLTKLRDRKYASYPNETSKNRALAKDAKTTLSQIQRMTRGALAPGIDMLELLAFALDVRPSDLITPYFVSTPKQDSEGVSPFPENGPIPFRKKPQAPSRS